MLVSNWRDRIDRNWICRQSVNPPVSLTVGWPINRATREKASGLGGGKVVVKQPTPGK